MLNLIFCSAECFHMQSTLVLIATTTAEVHKTIAFNEQIDKGPARALRTVPIIVTAHTFCASQDTRVFYGWCLLIQEYFCAV